MEQTTALPTCITTQCQCQCQQCEVCPSSSVYTIQASVITAIVTALLATVVFVVVIVAVCKFHPKFRSGGAEMSAGGEGQVYEEVDGDERNVTVLGGKGTYMEVGESGRKTFQLKENEAYGTRQ